MRSVVNHGRKRLRLEVHCSLCSPFFRHYITTVAAVSSGSIFARLLCVNITLLASESETQVILRTIQNCVVT